MPRYEYYVANGTDSVIHWYRSAESYCKMPDDDMVEIEKEMRKHLEREKDKKRYPLFFWRETCKK